MNRQRWRFWSNNEIKPANFHLFGFIAGTGIAHGLFVASLSVIPHAATATDFGDVRLAPAADCNAYATAYANAHVSTDPTDLPLVDETMRGAVAGGAWEGASGARRGAVVGGALSVLDSIGNTPAGWRGFYDMAYRACRNANSPVNHLPTTLGDPSHNPSRSPLLRPVPPLPQTQKPPMKSTN